MLSSLLEISRDTQAQTTTAAMSATAADKKASRILDDTTAIREAVSREDTPPVALSKLAYTTSDADLCRAAVAGKFEALDLFSKAGVTSGSLTMTLEPGVKGFCLEPLFLDPKDVADIGTVNKHFPIALNELDQLYMSQMIGFGSSKELEGAPALVKSFGLDTHRNAQILDVRASPLVLSIWGKNAAAFDLLMSKGVNPNSGAKMSVMGGSGGLYTLTVSPLAEAQRLNGTDMRDALQKRGSKVVTLKVAGVQ